MAITINIYYTGKNGEARKFAEELFSRGFIGDIRASKGNLRYEYFHSMDDPETVLLIDSWEDQASLNAHHSSETMWEITRIREKYGLRMRVERYVTEEKNVPQADKAFIKE